MPRPHELGARRGSHSEEDYEDEDDDGESPLSKFRRDMRMRSGQKGLRHFSLKVCEKVAMKKVTTYNEVRALGAECDG